MNNQNSLINKGILQNNVKRFWLLSMLTLIISFLFRAIPVFHEAEYFSHSDIEFTKEQILQNMHGSQILMLALGFVSAFLVFGYLFKERLSNQIHSFPINRITLFITNFVSGFLLIIVPQIITWIIMLPAFMKINNSGIIVLEYLICIISCSLIYYNFGVISAMITGNLISMIIIYGTINFFGIFISALKSLYGDIIEQRASFVFSHNILGDIYNLIAMLFPIKLFKISISGTYITDENNLSVQSMRYKVYLMYIIIACILTVISYFIYKKRNTETAGSGISLKKIKPAIIVITDALAAMALTFLIGFFLFDESVDGKSVLIIFLIAGLFSSAAVRMIFEKTVKINVFKECLRWVIISLSISIIFCAAEVITSRYMPKETQTEKIIVESKNYYDDGYNEFGITSVSDAESINKLYDITNKAKSKEKLIYFTKSLPDAIYNNYYDGVFRKDSSLQPEFLLTFKLKNGNELKRFIKTDDDDKKVLSKIFKENKMNSILENLEIDDLESAEFENTIDVGHSSKSFATFITSDDNIKNLLYAYAEDASTVNIDHGCRFYFEISVKSNKNNSEVTDYEGTYAAVLHFDTEYEKTMDILDKIISENGDSLSDIINAYDYLEDDEVYDPDIVTE